MKYQKIKPGRIRNEAPRIDRFSMYLYIENRSILGASFQKKKNAIFDFDISLTEIYEQLQ